MRVYVAAPLRGGEPGANLRKAIDAAEELLQAGHTPIVPHLLVTWDLVYPKPSEQWMALGREYLRLCEAVVRLPGISEGADAEAMEAARLGIHIYGSVDDLLRFQSIPLYNSPIRRKALAIDGGWIMIPPLLDGSDKI